MAAAAFLSMWISNTATAIMMVPIGMAIVSQMEAKFDEEKTHKFTVALMLGIAYACSLGGIATLVGTPPNLSFARIFEITFPKATPIAFGSWFIMGLPLSIVMIGIVWLVLTKIFFRVPADVTVDQSIVDKEYDELGSMSFEEKSVLTIFFSTAFLWVFRKTLNLGFMSIPGWSQLIAYPKLIDDGTVALVMAMILFLIPTRSKDAQTATVMGPEVIKNIPWNIVILFGGGFALAKGFQVTGLSTLIGNKFAGLAGMSPILMILIICFGLTFLTELTSNTATTEMILPILASVAFAMQANPLLLMIPATLSASCAFMMPVATPPNAIVFGSGRIKIAEMARVGVAINIIGVVVITALFYILGTAIFSIDPGGFPEWAAQMGTGAHN
jgi:sodium-dependent dicarboxylate transporter 2/3/5